MFAVADDAHRTPVEENAKVLIGGDDLAFVILVGFELFVVEDRKNACVPCRKDRLDPQRANREVARVFG
jgi:hypothetical protein